MLIGADRGLHCLAPGAAHRDSRYRRSRSGARRTSRRGPLPRRAIAPPRRLRRRPQASVRAKGGFVGRGGPRRGPRRLLLRDRDDPDRLRERRREGGRLEERIEALRPTGVAPGTDLARQRLRRPSRLRVARRESTCSWATARATRWREPWAVPSSAWVSGTRQTPRRPPQAARLCGDANAARPGDRGSHRGRAGGLAGRLHELLRSRGGAESMDTRHPCFDPAARHTSSRVHLPVAPACNIQCNYCSRSFDCVNESRPGVTTKVLSPEQALWWLDSSEARSARISRSSGSPAR